MGMGRNGNRLHGNGREWECKKTFPVISTIDPTKSGRPETNASFSTPDRA